MQIRSKFRLSAFLSVFMLLVLLAIMIISLVGYIQYQIFPLWALIMLFLFLGFTWAWIFYGELRTKVIRVELCETGLSINRYFGLGKTINFEYSDFDGFMISELPTRYSSYEYLYLLTSNKKQVKLSEYYHNNYEELKSYLGQKVEDLGELEFNLLEEIKEIFT